VAPPKVITSVPPPETVSLVDTVFTQPPFTFVGAPASTSFDAVLFFLHAFLILDAVC
jgi:hypothetical protein